MRILGLFDLVPATARGIGAQAPSAFPYRVDLLRHHGIELTHVHPASGRLHRKIRDVAEHRLGLPLDLAFRGMRKAQRADAVLAFLDSRAAFPSWSRRHALPPYARKSLAAISCWWAEELVTGSPAQKERIANLVSGCSIIFTFSANQREIFESTGFPSERVIPLKFGVDRDFYKVPVDPVQQRYEIFSAGIDRGRDFETLVAAARLLPDVRFTVVTKPGLVRNPPPNMELLPMTDMQGHRENLRASRLVVIPTHDLAYPTGQSVMLEAMACGKPVAVTETPAMNEYLRPGAQIVLPLRDAEGVATCLDSALRDPGDLDVRAQRGLELVATQFNYDHMWAEVAEALHAMSG